jgi:hypothetical protein
LQRQAELILGSPDFPDWILGESRAVACRQILAKSGLHLVKKSGFTEAWQRG